MIWLLLILFVPGGKNQGLVPNIRSHRVLEPCKRLNDSSIKAPWRHKAYWYNMAPPLVSFDSKLISTFCEPGVYNRANSPTYSGTHIEFHRQSEKSYTGNNCIIKIPNDSVNLPHVNGILLNKEHQLCEILPNIYFDVLSETRTNVAPDIASTTTICYFTFCTTMSNELEQKPELSLAQNFFSFFDGSSKNANIKEEKPNVPVVSNIKEEQNFDIEFKNATIRSPLSNVPHSEVTSPSLGQTCGRQKVLRTALIVDGQASKAAHWPWHVALYRIEKQSLRYICGGTLLSKTMVVTAGHCASIRGGAIIPELLRVHLGKHYLFERDIGQQEREVFKVILHPGFNGVTLDNDIALLKLKSEVIFTDYVQPACLWYEQAINKLPPMTIFGTVAGWGFDHQDSLSNILQQITIPLVSDLTCLISNPTFFSRLLKGNKFCAGFGNGSAVCNGDSGGGLMIFVPETPGGSTAGAWHVRGIVSVAPSIKERNACDPNQYTVFTDVEKYRDWVLDYLN